MMRPICSSCMNKCVLVCCVSSQMSVKQSTVGGALCLLCDGSCSGFQPHSWRYIYTFGKYKCIILIKPLFLNLHFIFYFEFLRTVFSSTINVLHMEYDIFK